MITLRNVYNADSITTYVDSESSSRVIYSAAGGVRSIDGETAEVVWDTADITRILGVAPLGNQFQVAIVDFRFTGFPSSGGASDTLTFTRPNGTTFIKTLPLNMTIDEVANRMAIDSDVRVMNNWFAACPGSSTTQSTLRFETFKKGTPSLPAPQITVTQGGFSTLAVTMKIQSNGIGA